MAGAYRGGGESLGADDPPFQKSALFKNLKIIFFLFLRILLGIRTA